MRAAAPLGGTLTARHSPMASPPRVAWSRRPGSGGLTLGGGLGWMRRQHGLSCDNLASVEIVTADGEIRRASEEENPDLFWGIRGGGGNFGVVTEFEYHLHTIGPEVMFAFVLYPLEDGLEVLQGWRAFCDAAPDEVSSVVLCGTAPGADPFPPEVQGRQFRGNLPRFIRVCRRRESGSCSLSAPSAARFANFSARTPYVKVQSTFDEDYPDGGRYYWKSLYLDRFDDAAIERVLSSRRPAHHRCRPSMSGNSAARWHGSAPMRLPSGRATRPICWEVEAKLGRSRG